VGEDRVRHAEEVDVRAPDHEGVGWSCEPHARTSRRPRLLPAL